jgi:hypothetical protein
VKLKKEDQKLTLGVRRSACRWKAAMLHGGLERPPVAKKATFSRELVEAISTRWCLAMLRLGAKPCRTGSWWAAENPASHNRPSTRAASDSLPRSRSSCTRVAGRELRSRRVRDANRPRRRVTPTGRAGECCIVRACVVPSIEEGGTAIPPSLSDRVMSRQVLRSTDDQEHHRIVTGRRAVPATVPRIALVVRK